MTRNQSPLVYRHPAARQFRRIRLTCQCCEKKTEFTGADGEDIVREMVRQGWERHPLKIARADQSEDYLGRCPVCVGLGRVRSGEEAPASAVTPRFRLAHGTLVASL